VIDEEFCRSSCERCPHTEKLEKDGNGVPLPVVAPSPEPMKEQIV